MSVTPRAGDEKFERNFVEIFESWSDELESEIRMSEGNPKWGRGFSRRHH